MPTDAVPVEACAAHPVALMHLPVNAAPFTMAFMAPVLPLIATLIDKPLEVVTTELAAPVVHVWLSWAEPCACASNIVPIGLVHPVVAVPL